MKRRVRFSRITFLLLGLSVLITGCGGGGGDSSSNNNTNNNTNNSTTSYTISGNVMNDASLGGTGLSGVTVNLTGGVTASTTTDSNGNYSFSVSNGTYTVTPSLSGFGFSPASTTVTISDANSTGHAFIASAAATSGISGMVTPAYPNMSVCAVDITDPANPLMSCTSADAATGSYSLPDPVSGSFVLTALLDINNNGSADGGELYGAYSTSQNGTATPVMLNNSGATGIDITVTPLAGSSISGTVTNLGPAAGPIMVVATSRDTYLGFGITTADPSTGAYNLSAIPNGTYAVFAWADLNGNGSVDYGEPMGAFTSLSSPTLVTVNNANWNSIDFTIQ